MEILSQLDDGVCLDMVLSHLDCVEYFILTGKERENKCNISIMGAIRGHKGCISEVDQCVIGCLAVRGDLELFEWAVNISGCSFDKRWCETASLGGHLHLLKWLNNRYDNVVLNDYWTVQYASMHGHIHILKWIKECGGILNEKTCEGAVLGNKLGTLKWLRENGCNWNNNICSYASSKGNLDILKYALENGCDIDVNECFIRAIQNNHIHIAKWLLDNGYEYDDE